MSLKSGKTGIWALTTGNQPLIFIGRSDAEAEALKLWPPDA